jgi:hypothetical protein
MKRIGYQFDGHISLVLEWWQPISTILLFINPLRGPGIIVALIATFLEEVGQCLPWYILVLICLINLLAIRLMSLIVIEALCSFLEFLSKLSKYHQEQLRRGKQHQRGTLGSIIISEFREEL